MFNSWFGKSSKASPYSPGLTAHSPSPQLQDEPGLSQSTLEPPPSGLANPSSVHLESPLSSTDKITDPYDAHTQINDPNSYSGPITIPISTDPDPLISLEDSKPSPKPSESPPSPQPIFTPHDAVLAELQGHPSDAADSGTAAAAAAGDHSNANEAARPVNDAPMGQTGDRNASTAGTFSTFTSAPTQPPATETIYDPFNGQKLGEYMAKQPLGGGPDLFGRGGRDEELWTHLSRILELQSEIAGMHIDMEGVGARSKRARSGSVSASAAARERVNTSDRGADKDRSKENGRSGRALSGKDDEDEDGGAAGDEDTDHDEEGEGKRKRDEEFARLSERFEERKGAVDSIMYKLDDLSAALKTFHALRTPTVDLPTSLQSPNTSTDASSLPAMPQFPRDKATDPPVPPFISSPASSFSVPAHVAKSNTKSGILEEVQHMVDSPLDMHHGSLPASRSGTKHD